MGKTDAAANRPTNTSISYTLNNLRSIVELELRASGGADVWEPLKTYNGRGLASFELSQKGRDRFLNHLALLKEKFAVTASFTVRSGNDFPSDCGLASSASSFAALTRAGSIALTEISGLKEPSARELSELSRKGSGSSCRSFFSPWSIWDGQGASPLELPQAELIHQVIVVDAEKKSVSSSQAHARVTSSLLFMGRIERAELRARELTAALREKNWARAFETTWAEFWDMHALFETSRPSFSYMSPASLEVLRLVRRETWEKNSIGPLITMDAGPNIHLLHLADGSGESNANEVCEMFRSRYRVITDGLAT